MFKKRQVKGNVRKKRALDEDAAQAEPEEVVTAVVREPEKKKMNTFSSAPVRKRDEEFGVFEKSEGSEQHVYGGGATAQNEIDTSTDRDARALLERTLKLHKDGQTNDETKLYKGQAGYKQYIEKKESQIGANKHTGTQGPIRAPAFFRASSRFDYQPDICKDYKDTGFCGFGDSCKFLHDRGNYKTGWQLEQEWDEKQHKRKQMIAMGLDPDKKEQSEERKYHVEEEDELPFACFLCRGPFKDPIVTPCTHLFCRRCIVASHKSTPFCPVCGKNTSGIFNHPVKLELAAKKFGGYDKFFKEKSKEAGEEQSEEEEEEEQSEAAVESKEEPTVQPNKGAWDVVVQEENEGVGELLEAEAAGQEEGEGEEEKQVDDQVHEDAGGDTSTEDKQSAGDEKEQQEDSEAKLVELAGRMGWQKVGPVEGKQYWFNATLNQTCWVTPKAVLDRFASEQKAEKLSSQLPPTSQWKAAVDAQGRAYYYHPRTGETSWVPR